MTHPEFRIAEDDILFFLICFLAWNQFQVIVTGWPILNLVSEKFSMDRVLWRRIPVQTYACTGHISAGSNDRPTIRNLSKGNHVVGFFWCCGHHSSACNSHHTEWINCERFKSGHLVWRSIVRCSDSNRIKSPVTFFSHPDIDQVVRNFTSMVAETWCPRQVNRTWCEGNDERSSGGIHHFCETNQKERGVKIVADGGRFKNEEWKWSTWKMTMTWLLRNRFAWWCWNYENKYKSEHERIQIEHGFLTLLLTLRTRTCWRARKFQMMQERERKENWQHWLVCEARAGAFRGRVREEGERVRVSLVSVSLPALFVLLPRLISWVQRNDPLFS